MKDELFTTPSEKRSPVDRATLQVLQRDMVKTSAVRVAARYLAGRNTQHEAPGGHSRP